MAIIFVNVTIYDSKNKKRGIDVSSNWLLSCHVPLRVTELAVHIIIDDSYTTIMNESYIADNSLFVEALLVACT